MTTTITQQFDILTSLFDSSKRIVGDMRITRRTKLADKPHKYGAMEFTRVSATIATNRLENVTIIAHNRYPVGNNDKPEKTFVFDKTDTAAAESAYKWYSALPLDTTCNHCITKRYRNSIFYGIDTSTSTDVQYGSSCMEDYINKDDLDMITKLEDLEHKSSKIDSIIPDKWFLKHAVTIVLDGIYDLKKETAESLELKLQNEYPEVVARLGQYHNQLIDNPFSIAQKIRESKRFIDICKTNAKAKETATTPIIEKPREFTEIQPKLVSVPPKPASVKPKYQPKTKEEADNWDKCSPEAFWKKFRSGAWNPSNF